MLLFLLLSVAEPALPEAALAPPCSVPGHAVAIRKSELPADVLREVDAVMADPDKPFRRTDALVPGEEELPTMRLICGYRTLDGYVIERELGGRAYSIGKLIFRRTATGYAPANG